MKRTVKFLAVAALAALSHIAVPGAVTAEPLVRASFYDMTPYWKQTMTFPRWEDTYVIVFEQEMLA